MPACTQLMTCMDLRIWCPVIILYVGLNHYNNDTQFDADMVYISRYQMYIYKWFMYQPGSGSVKIYKHV